MIYLASPYTHEDAVVLHWRYKQACKAAAALITQGEMVFCPIAHSHGIAVYGGLGGDWQQWEAMDDYFLNLCDRLVVLMLPGWESSVGIKAEVAAATRNGQSVEYMEWDDGDESQAYVDTPGFRRWLQAVENRPR